MEGRYKKIFLSSLILLTAGMVGFYFLTNLAFAEDGDLIITEIMYDPVESCSGDKTEWIEIFANKDKTFTLKKNSAGKYAFKDFYLCTSGKESEQSSFNCTNSFPVYPIIEEKLEIKKGDIFVIAEDPDIFQKTYQELINIIVLRSPFNLSSKDGAFIAYSLGVDLANKKIWQEKTNYYQFFDEKPFGRSLEKIDFTKENDKSNWQESFNYGGTPGEKSSMKKIYPDGITISELLPDTANPDDEGEFIELYNSNDFDVDLTDWSLGDKTKNYSFSRGNCGEKESYKNIIPRKGFLVIEKERSKISLNNTGGEEIVLRDPNGDLVEKVSYSESTMEGWSFAIKNGEFYWTPFPTPGKENQFEEFSDAEKVFLNEIFPNPKKDEKSGEFIEIISKENEFVDLYGWVIRDASKTGKYIFKEHRIINPDQYLVIYRPQFKIALNNSLESVYLYNALGRLTSSASYTKAPISASYNFNGTNWKWSKFLTPGAKNRFDSPPTVRIRKPKSAYRNLYAKFKVRARDKETKKLKFVWDFGDGHKSYLKETSHKYLKAGKYEVKLTVRDESQAVEKNFSLEVRKYPRPKVEIVELTPNPSGRDTELETLVLKNNSGKVVNLKNYKIATGSKNLYNHPIIKNFALQAGEEKIITRRVSRFTLNNKAGKVRLVYPDSKITDEVAYAKEKIADDEIFAKVDGEWRWISPPEKKKSVDEKNNPDDQPGGKTEEPNGGEVLGASDENSSYARYQAGFNPEDAFMFLKLLGFFDSPPKNKSFCRENKPQFDLAFLFIPDL